MTKPKPDSARMASIPHGVVPKILADWTNSESEHAGGWRVKTTLRRESDSRESQKATELPLG